MGLLQRPPFFSAHDGYRPVAFLLAGILAVGMYVAVLHVPDGSRPRWVLEARRHAVETIRTGQAVLRRDRAQRGLALSRADRLHTGLVGVESSSITTALASAPAKRTSTNPVWGAVVVDMLYRAGVRPGDSVALGLSGSFPALNFAAEAAVEAVGATPLAISSVGSSQWGANEPSFAWPHMEDVLYRSGILHHRSIAVALGGSKGEDATSPPYQARQQIARASGLPLIPPLRLRQEVDYRVGLYAGREARLAGPLEVFVNVGGSEVDIGAGNSGDIAIPSGLSRPRFTAFEAGDLGVVGMLGRAGLPIINLRDIGRLADRYDLPWDPTRAPSASDLARPAPDPKAVGAALGLILILLFVAHRLGVFRFPDWSPPPALEAKFLRADAAAPTADISLSSSFQEERSVAPAGRRLTREGGVNPE